METNLGKSNHHSPIKSFTHECDTRTILKCTTTKNKGLQIWQVYSSFHSLRITLQFQRTIKEVGTLHFYDFQTIHALNLTHRIALKGRPAES